ncbi:MAG: tRNA (adenosine(37)-N6)-dimethylallyltransferase MiaA [Deltaproteobacteria bacterium]|nr:tRNA (adenosine(37)-N6)-dimethylallyltransferase MiaA [Deltaproteobacteria bacterium]
MNDRKQKLIVITGPTATGKSGLAIELALELGGEILSADSMQVYKGMDIGTAKTPLDERKGVPHHLLDVVDPDEEFNASIFRSLSLPLLAEIQSRGNVGLVVGGTGLYIKVLLGGLLYCPSPDPDLKSELKSLCDQEGSQFLHGQLQMLDPESAEKIHPNDGIRIIRALEIIQSANDRLSSIRRQHAFKDKPFDVMKICLNMKREDLYDRINKRCLHMVENGLVEEVEGLLEKGYASHLRPMQSIGYRHVSHFLEGTWDLEKTISQLKVDTRRYAKRQLTWFRADPEMIWLGPEAQIEVHDKIRAFLGEE